jgi:hypothetical protein
MYRYIQCTFVYIVAICARFVNYRVIGLIETGVVKVVVIELDEMNWIVRIGLAVELATVPELDGRPKWHDDLASCSENLLHYPIDKSPYMMPIKSSNPVQTTSPINVECHIFMPDSPYELLPACLQDQSNLADSHASSV